MSNNNLTSLFQKQLTRKEFLGLGAVAIASLFGVAGLVRTLASHAATPAVSLEPEDGTVSGGASLIADAAASGGTAVAFGKSISSALATETRWLSGASGNGVSDGSFASWRGTAVPIFGSWSNDDNNMQNFYQLSSSTADNFASWSGSGDIAVGAFSATGENWASAASGAYDAMWTTCFKTAKEKWTSISRGSFYMRFAHEWNGNWYAWSVAESNIVNFQTAWARFRALQQQYFPECKLVCCINGETSGQTYDWVSALPSPASYDVLGVDYYSNHWLNTAQYDSYGAPRQLASLLSAAKTLGKPLAFPEWGNNSDNGDHPEYIQAMHDFYAANAGTSAGNVLYEILFNVNWTPTNQFGLYPVAQTLAPNAAARYQAIF